MSKRLILYYLVIAMVCLQPVQADVGNCSDFDVDELSLEIYSGSNLKSDTRLDAAFGHSYTFRVNSGNLNLSDFGITSFTWIQTNTNNEVEDRADISTAFKPEVSYDNLGTKFLTLASGYTCLSSFDDSVSDQSFSTVLDTFEIVSTIPEIIQDADQKIDSSNNTIGYVLVNRGEDLVDQPYYAQSPIRFKLNSNSEIDTNLIDYISSTTWNYANVNNQDDLSTSIGDPSTFLLTIDEPGTYSVAADIKFVTDQELSLDFEDLEIKEGLSVSLTDRFSQEASEIRITKKKGKYFLTLTPLVEELANRRFRITLSSSNYKHAVKVKKVVRLKEKDEPVTLPLKINSYKKLPKSLKNLDGTMKIYLEEVGVVNSSPLFQLNFEVVNENPN